MPATRLKSPLVIRPRHVQRVDVPTASPAWQMLLTGSGQARCCSARRGWSPGSRRLALRVACTLRFFFAHVRWRVFVQAARGPRASHRRGRGEGGRTCLLD